MVYKPSRYMKIKNLIVFTFIGLMAISCNKDPNDVRILNLEGEFVISADQELTDNGPKFGYRITTLNDQDCKSSDILYTLIDQEGELNLILEDITQIDDCPTEEGKVEETIPLNIANGTTDIAISLRNVVKNTGTIETTELQHTLELDTPEGILIGNKIVNRMPSQVVFGYIYDANQDPVDSSLLDSLSSFSNRVLIDGYYTSSFSIDNQQALFLDNITTPPIHNDVYYHLEDKESFLSFIEQYKSSHSNYFFNLRDAATGEVILL